MRESGVGKRERVTMGGKGRSEIRKVVDVSTMGNLGKRCGALCGWGLPSGKLEVLLVVGWLVVKRNVEV